LDEIKKLCSKLDELWLQNESTCVLFTWISFLTDDLFDFLNIDLDKDDLKITSLGNETSDAEPRAIKQSCSSVLLKDYDKDQCELKFQKGYFTCNVCLSEIEGKKCMKFNKCEHVFCNECMKGYFDSLIADGNVKSLICPQDKCEEQALPAQVLTLVGIEMFNRYDSLLLKDSLNNMSDIVYCPRANCQCAVIPEDTLAQCTNCNYVFCALCRQGYHGIEVCKLSNGNRIFPFCAHLFPFVCLKF
jgi:E3 ubiquitin-protein ligase RNF14